MEPPIPSRSGRLERCEGVRPVWPPDDEDVGLEGLGDVTGGGEPQSFDEALDPEPVPSGSSAISNLIVV